MKKPKFEYTDGVKIRAQIDNEQIWALLLINGGGAVALISILPKVLDGKELVPPIIIGLLFLVAGLMFAVISNQFRRKCSLAHENNTPHGKFLRWSLVEPFSCWLGRKLMWASVACFGLAGLFVAICTWYAAS